MSHPVRRPIVLRLALAAALAVVLTACGNGDDTADADGTAAVTVEGFGYDPNPIEVGVGTTIEWTNEDSAPHTVTAGAPGDATGEFDESLSGSGGTASITFDEAGTFAYFCSVHPNMTAEVVVQ